jgi:hypothetical protein
MMRETILFLSVAVLLTGCTAEPPEPGKSIRTAGAPVECLNLDRIVSRRPSGEGSILFETTGGRNYRNVLPGQCPGLERAGPGHIVEVEATGGQLCRGDRVRVYDPIEARNMGSGAFPQCRLGVFAPLDPPSRN